MNTKQFVLVVFCSMIIFSCKKDDATMGDYSITKEIEKIETSYSEGDIKLEFLLGDNEKVETVASEKYMKELLVTLEKSFTKQKTYLKSGSTYYTKGVFKNTSCGSYKELSIFMDCEDSGNNSLKVNGDAGVGSSNVDSNGNITYKVCVVDDVFFGPYSFYNYGVLNLGVQEPGVSRLVRGFDNEDSGNANSAVFDGSNYSGIMGDCVIGNGFPNNQLSFSYVDDNDERNLWLVAPFYDRYNMPNIGFSYYVLAKWNTGYIHSDDEDRRNSNYCYYESLSTGVSYYASGTFDGVLDVGANTNIHFSKVN